VRSYRASIALSKSPSIFASPFKNPTSLESSESRANAAFVLYGAIAQRTLKELCVVALYSIVEELQSQTVSNGSFNFCHF
jgi:hypothetical protein